MFRSRQLSMTRGIRENGSWKDVKRITSCESAWSGIRINPVVIWVVATFESAVRSIERIEKVV
jgi:hypothetical protein